MITYAYLRTLIALEHDDSLEGLWDYLKGQDVVFFLAKNDEIIEWDDGVVIKIESWMSLDGLAQNLSFFLDKLETWALFDGVKHVEHPKGRPLTSFLETANESDTRHRYAQIFVQYGDEPRDSQRLIANIRKRIRESCRPIFYFRDGVVLLVKSDIPGRIINQRCRNCLENLRAWLIIDANDECHTDTGPVDSVWLPLEKIRPPVGETTSPARS